MYYLARDSKTLQGTMKELEFPPGNKTSLRNLESLLEFRKIFLLDITLASMFPQDSTLFGYYQRGRVLRLSKRNEVRYQGAAHQVMDNKIHQDTFEHL